MSLHTPRCGVDDTRCPYFLRRAPPYAKKVNKAAKSALKTDIKKFEAAVVEGNRSEAEGAYKVAVKAVDKAVVKGLLHKNNAAHKKSAMTIKLNKLA